MYTGVLMSLLERGPYYGVVMLMFWVLALHLGGKASYNWP